MLNHYWKINESTNLKDQIEAYKNRFGFYPESVHADQIYRNRENRRYCKKYKMRLSGPKLGRPPKQTEENKDKIKALKKLARQDEIDRIAIEGKFGQAKRRYSLNRIMTKLNDTSKTAIITSHGFWMVFPSKNLYCRDSRLKKRST